ncbi:GDSL esterase/lipase APG-like [Capsicum galapagoense]
MADALDFTTYRSSAYLSPQASGENLLIGANFATAGAGYDDKTSILNELYGQGARRIGVTSLPPLGCLPAVKTLFGFHKSGCISRINRDAQHFNKKMNSSATKLRKQLPGLKIARFDVFQPIYDLVKSPSDHRFAVANRACCGTGKVVTTSFFCNPSLAGTCKNAREYVFWDSVHPSQAANQVQADSLIIQGISLLG